MIEDIITTKTHMKKINHLSQLEAIKQPFSNYNYYNYNT